MLKRARYVALHTPFPFHGFPCQVFRKCTVSPKQQRWLTSSHNEISYTRSPLELKISPSAIKLEATRNVGSQPLGPTLRTFTDDLNKRMQEFYDNGDYKACVSDFRKALPKFRNDWLKSERFIHCCILACSCYDKLSQPLKIKRVYGILTSKKSKLTPQLNRLFLSYATGCINYGHKAALECFDNSPKELIDYNLWLSWLCFSRAPAIVVWMTFTRLCSAGHTPDVETYEHLFQSLSSQKHEFLFDKSHDLFQKDNCCWRPSTFRILVESFVRLKRMSDAESIIHRYIQQNPQQAPNEALFVPLLRHYAATFDLSNMERILSLMKNCNTDMSTMTLNVFLCMAFQRPDHKNYFQFCFTKISQLLKKDVQLDFDSILLISQFMNQIRVPENLKPWIDSLISRFSLPERCSLPVLRKIQEHAFCYPLLQSKLPLAIETLRLTGFDWNVATLYIGWLFSCKRVTDAINFFYSVTIEIGNRPSPEMFHTFMSGLLGAAPSEKVLKTVHEIQSKYPLICDSSSTNHIILFLKSISFSSTPSTVKRLMQIFEADASVSSSSLMLAVAEWLFTRDLFQSSLLYATKVIEMGTSYNFFRPQILVCWCYYRLRDFRSLSQHVTYLLQTDNAALLRALATSLKRISQNESNLINKQLLMNLKYRVLLRAQPSRDHSPAARRKALYRGRKLKKILLSALQNQASLGNLLS
ncbi:uncharacterized protein SOCG_01423 [Schizosaccharomyces octosporus yFS286]|uniref:Uncharacterized protein n=1 Tax=Schizosaccharomyces octosporus (strain yFS286) TaxID=483514 RepID=S9QY36_SCHOY|nr:uncharacterized protein SOCG_01423 [Schizosaccharomyces octosporus yFS286]EPX71205.1 hypothetical protein SOCG_01423 [Schizosaccharomyces octosporus yFS286]